MGQAGRQAGGCMPLTASEINAHTVAQPVATNGNSCRRWHAKTLPQGAAAARTPAKISINKRNDNNVSTRKYNKPLSEIKTCDRRMWYTLSVVLWGFRVVIKILLEFFTEDSLKKKKASFHITNMF